MLIKEFNGFFKRLLVSHNKQCFSWVYIFSYKMSNPNCGHSNTPFALLLAQHNGQ